VLFSTMTKFDGQGDRTLNESEVHQIAGRAGRFGIHEEGFVGVLQDAEVRASYTMPLNDITFFAGYRYSQLDASGTTNGFGYDADLTLDGYQFGVAVTF